MIRTNIELDERLVNEGLKLTHIKTKKELVNYAVKENKYFKNIKDYLLEFPIFHPKNIQTYLDAVQIYRNCRKHGKTVRKTVDCIISAICIENDLTLLHKDGDFEIIEKYAELKTFRS